MVNVGAVRRAAEPCGRLRRAPGARASRRRRCPRSSASIARRRSGSGSSATATTSSREPGFACKAEILAKLSALGVRVEEVPVPLDWTRRLGKSKMPVVRTTLAYWRMLLRLRWARARRVVNERPERRDRRRRHPRDDRRVPARAGRRPRRALRALERPRRARRVVRLRRLSGRSLLPRHPARPTTASAASRRSSGSATGWRFRPTKVGFYGDGPAVLDDLAEGVPDVPAAAAARPRPTRRRSSRAASSRRTTTSSTTTPLLDWLRRRSGKHVARADVGAAARLEVRRALRRPARPPTSGRARAGCRRRATSRAPR